MNLHPLFPAITAQHVLAECTRELAQRRNFYPGRVAEMRMTQEEADHQLSCAAAWQQDAQRIAASDYTPAPLAAATHGLTWAARRDSLRRELLLRARVYPGRVAEMRMTQAEADHRRDCLMALAARYDDGFDWIASNGARTRFGLVDAPEEILAARREWQDHSAAVDTARAPLQQKELL
jgi:hypothetical protein